MYKVAKTDVLGIGPWYVVNPQNVDIRGTFRLEEDARLFADALNQAQQEDSFDCKHEWIGLHGHPAAYECKKCRKLSKYGRSSRYVQYTS
jgi:hypothetical protein